MNKAQIMKTHAASNIHKEQVVQEHLIEQLVSTQGYVRRIGSEHSGGYDGTIHFDKTWAMDGELVLRFVQNTQPEAWQKLNKHYPGSAEGEFFKQLDQALKSRGLLDVLRQGIKIVPGIVFTLCYFRPASGLEPKRMDEYEANILSVMDEVAYRRRHRPNQRDNLELVAPKTYHIVHVDKLASIINNRYLCRW